MLPRLLLCLLAFVSLALSPALAQPPAVNWSADTPTAAPPAVAPASVLVKAESTATPRVSASFKKTLSKAADEAYREGQITRWELARIRMAIAFRPEAVAEIQASCCDEAVAAGKMKPADGNASAFDWTALLDFIKQLLPLILQIISIFK
jgi:hypothetical protein